MKKAFSIILFVTIILTGCSNLKKSEYTNIDSVDFVEIIEKNKSYPVEFSKITFNIICKSVKQYYCSTNAENTLEVNKNNEWYIVPSKNNTNLANAMVIFKDDVYPIEIDQSDYDYDFQEGEYRYVLNIFSDSDNKEQVIYYFNLSNT